MLLLCFSRYSLGKSVRKYTKINTSQTFIYSKPSRKIQKFIFMHEKICQSKFRRIVLYLHCKMKKNFMYKNSLTKSMALWCKKGQKVTIIDSKTYKGLYETEWLSSLLKNQPRSVISKKTLVSTKPSFHKGHKIKRS